VIDAVTKETLEILIQAVRDEHVALVRLGEQFAAVLASLDSETKARTEVNRKEAADRDSTSMPFRDGITARLDEVLRRLEHS
jgi:hypothetical protein